MFPETECGPNIFYRFYCEQNTIDRICKDWKNKLGQEIMHDVRA